MEETAKQGLDIFSEYGAITILAFLGLILPYIILFGIYRLARYGIDKCKAVLDSIDKKLEGK